MWLVEREKGERGKQALCMQANFSVSTEKQSEFKGGKPDCCGPRAESGFLTLHYVNKPILMNNQAINDYILLTNRNWSGLTEFDPLLWQAKLTRR